MFHTSSDRRLLREAIAAIMAEYGVSETSAYAMHVRAAAGLPTKQGEHPEPSEASASGQSRLTGSPTRATADSVS